MPSASERLSKFPRSAKYHPGWIKACGMGSHPLWLAEWLAEDMQLKPGMRVLDLGCGRAASSIFLAREFGVEVWAVDLWISAAENHTRIRDAGVADRVFPLHASALSLPFAPEFFDTIHCVDAFSYFGTEALYLNYLAQFVKVEGRLGIAGAGLTKEIEGPLPEHLREFWTQDFWCLHSAPWWRRHWERTGIVAIEQAEAMADGAKVWLKWQEEAYPQNVQEIETLCHDGGANLGFIRMIGRRLPNVPLQPYCWPDTLRSLPAEYSPQPILREGEE